LTTLVAVFALHFLDTMTYKTILATLSLLAATQAKSYNLTDPLPPVASSFSAIVAFGDNLCDNGTGAYTYSGGVWPPSF
jgi:hypothetical protein